MIYRLSFICVSFFFMFFGCKKKEETTSINTVSPNEANHIKYYYKDSVFHNSPHVSCNKIQNAFDSLIIVEDFNLDLTDTVRFSFVIKTKGKIVGTYTLDSTNIGGNNRLILNYTTSDIYFFSKSGTVTIEKFDDLNDHYKGSFSGTMYLSTNPSFTFNISNGTFFNKKQ